MYRKVCEERRGEGSPTISLLFSALSPSSAALHKSISHCFNHPGALPCLSPLDWTEFSDIDFIFSGCTVCCSCVNILYCLFCRHQCKVMQSSINPGSSITQKGKKKKSSQPTVTWVNVRVTDRFQGWQGQINRLGPNSTLARRKATFSNAYSLKLKSQYQNPKSFLNLLVCNTFPPQTSTDPHFPQF